MQSELAVCQRVHDHVLRALGLAEGPEPQRAARRPADLGAHKQAATSWLRGFGASDPLRGHAALVVEQLDAGPRKSPSRAPVRSTVDVAGSRPTGRHSWALSGVLSSRPGLSSRYSSGAYCSTGGTDGSGTLGMSSCATSGSCSSGTSGTSSLGTWGTCRCGSGGTSSSCSPRAWLCVCGIDTSSDRLRRDRRLRSSLVFALRPKLGPVQGRQPRSAREPVIRVPGALDQSISTPSPSSRRCCSGTSTPADRPDSDRSIPTGPGPTDASL
jgi:hypothetical protein